VVIALRPPIAPTRFAPIRENALRIRANLRAVDTQFASGSVGVPVVPHERVLKFLPLRMTRGGCGKRRDSIGERLLDNAPGELATRQRSKPPHAAIIG